MDSEMLKKYGLGGGEKFFTTLNKNPKKRSILHFYWGLHFEFIKGPRSAGLKYIKQIGTVVVGNLSHYPKDLDGFFDITDLIPAEADKKKQWICQNSSLAIAALYEKNEGFKK